MGYCSANATRYAGVFLAVAPSNSNIPAIFSYQHNNTGTVLSALPRSHYKIPKLRDQYKVGQAKRSMGAVMMIAGGGLGGIIASLVFRQQDAPKYNPGLYTVLVAQVCPTSYPYFVST